MTKYRVEVWVNYHYGGLHLSFSKSFDLPFIPFVGLILLDKYKDDENEIRMENHSCKRPLEGYDHYNEINETKQIIISLKTICDQYIVQQQSYMM